VGCAHAWRSRWAQLPLQKGIPILDGHLVPPVQRSVQLCHSPYQGCGRVQGRTSEHKNSTAHAQERRKPAP